MFFIVWDRLWQRFASAPSVADVALVVSLRNQLVDISGIIRFVQTQVLFACWSSDHDRNDKVIHGPFVMLIGAGDVNGQRRSSFIDQDVHLGPTLASVCWITSSGLPTQWRGNRLAVDSLPLPADSTLAGIEADQAPHDLLPDTLLLPGLESLVQHAARNTKPVSVDGFPLATSPQHIPNAVDDRPVVSTWPSRPWFLGWLGQVSLDTAPEWAWNSEVIDILWLCATLYFADGAPREMLVLHKNNSLRGASFFHVYLFFG